MPTAYWLSCIIIKETLIQQLLMLMLMVLPFPCSFHNLKDAFIFYVTVAFLRLL
jgi:hypothetical protein